MSLLGILTLTLASPYAWGPSETARPLAERVAPPSGFERVSVEPGSFAAWLRALPVRPGRPEVRLFDGTRKRNQEAHHLVLDLDVGAQDLQQCADAVIRLHAEWRWSTLERESICHRLTSGTAVPWARWRAGERLSVKGSRVTWVHGEPGAGDHADFRRYLDVVFTYAGTLSLARDLRPVADPSTLRAGDVFIQGGSPGRAVIVLDVAKKTRGTGPEVAFLLAQSYMPAQEVHVLRAPGPKGDGAGPWYFWSPTPELVTPELVTPELVTPEWRFDWKDLRRFPDDLCR